MDLNYSVSCYIMARRVQEFTGRNQLELLTVILVCLGLPYLEYTCVCICNINHIVFWESRLC